MYLYLCVFVFFILCIIVFVLYLCGGEVDGDGFQLTFSSIPRGVRRKAHSIATQAAGSFVLYSNCISIVLYVIYIVLKLYFYFCLQFVRISYEYICVCICVFVYCHEEKRVICTAALSL